MKYLKVNYKVNKRFFVEDGALAQLLKKAVASIKNISLEDYKISIAENQNTFSAKLWIVKKSDISYKEITNKIMEEIEERTLLLTKTKPENIQIIFREVQ